MTNTTRTRYLVITSMLVTVVGLGTGLVAYYKGGGPLSALLGNDGPAELSYVPRDAAVVAYADVRSIMTSDVRQRILRAMPVSENGRREFQDQTGIDIESDIDRVVACLEPGAEGHSNGLVLARGRFSDVRIEALMREHGAVVETYNGKRVIAYRNRPSPSGNNITLTFLEPGLIALGSDETVHHAIDLQKGGDTVTKNAELMDLLRSVERNDAWVVGRFDALKADNRLPPEVAGRLPAVTWFTLGARADANIAGVVRVDSLDEAAANTLRDVVRGFLALARLQAGGRPEFQGLAQSLELGGSGRTVTLSFAVPGEVFDAVGGTPRRGAPPAPAH